MGQPLTSVLLHQADKRVQAGSSPRHVDVAERVLCCGHHEHPGLDLGHVVDGVVARHLIGQPR